MHRSKLFISSDSLSSLASLNSLESIRIDSRSSSRSNSISDANSRSNSRSNSIDKKVNNYTEETKFIPIRRRRSREKSYDIVARSPQVEDVLRKLNLFLRRNSKETNK